MSLTSGDVGLLLIVASTAAFVGGVLPRARVFGILVGVIVYGLAGPAGRWLHWAAVVTGWAQVLTDKVVGWAAGVTIPGLLALGLAAVVIFDLHPKGGRASRRTFWAAAALGVMIATASTNVTFLNQIGPQVVHGTQQVQSGS